MNERYRPQVHFTPRSGWMNDPNGLVYFEGEYHLFYQYQTHSHWGHAVSTDLVHWRHLPVALYPDEVNDIWSGSVVVDEEDTSGFFGGRPGLVAFFTYGDATNPPRNPQMQAIAYSTDRGRTWAKYAHNPILANPGVADFRDPKVFWHASTHRWVMVLSLIDHVSFYSSSDLKNWSHASDFGTGYGVQNVAWECPDLFQLPVDGQDYRARWVLQVSVWQRFGRREFPEYRDMQYFIGDFDGTTFTSDNPRETILWTDYGRDDYAVVSWANMPPGDGRRIWMGWMSNWAYAFQVPTEPWQGAMTLPREVRLCRLAEGVRLRQMPIPELRALRTHAAHWADLPVTPAWNVRTGEDGDALEIIADLEPGSATECGIRIRYGESQQTVVGYNVAQGNLFVDRTQSGKTDFSPVFAGRHGGPLSIRAGKIHLHVFVDRSSVEVFGNDGEVVVSSLVFPESGTTDVELYAQGGQCRASSLAIFHLQSIWDEEGGHPV